jgi:hypothetical protein
MLSLIHTLWSSLQLVLSLLSLLCVHRLSGNGNQHHRSLNFCVHGFLSSLAVAYLTVALELASNCKTLNSAQLHSTSSRSTPLHWLSSTWSVMWYSLGADPTENTIPLLMWVAWYHMFHCRDTVRLLPDRLATRLPAALLMVHVISMDVTCSSIACAIIVNADKLFTLP